MFLGFRDYLGGILGRPMGFSDRRTGAFCTEYRSRWPWSLLGSAWVHGFTGIEDGVVGVTVPQLCSQRCPSAVGSGSGIVSSHRVPGTVGRQRTSGVGGVSSDSHRTVEAATHCLRRSGRERKRWRTRP